MKLSYNLKHKLNEGNLLFQYLAAVTGTLAIISCGMHTGWPSPSLHQLLAENSTIHITNEEGSWLAVMPLIGGAAGSLIAAATIDVLGRKKIILLTAIPLFTAWIMVAYAKSITDLIIGRIIAGAADGITFTAVPIYLGEVAEAKSRGLLGSSCSVTYIFGFLLINLVGSYFTITVTALISSVLPIVLLLLFMWMPESPYYLLMRDKYDQAKESLQVFRGAKDVDTEMNRISTAVNEQTKNSGKVLDLFTIKSNRRALFIALGLRTVQQFSGTMAITFYAKPIFSASSNMSANAATLLYFVIQLGLSIVSSAVVDKSGRRPLLITSIIGTAVSLCVEGVYFYIHDVTDIDTTSFNFVQVTALVGFVSMFSLGMQTIPILILCELFPTNVKAFALCFVDIYFYILATIVSKFFQIMKDYFGMYVPFFVFAGCSAIGLIFLIYCVPETKGKTLEDIQKHLRNEYNEVENNET